MTFTTNLPDGTYPYQIKGVRNLANADILDITDGQTSVEFGMQRAGDANNSNFVNVPDFNILKTQLCVSEQA